MITRNVIIVLGVIIFIFIVGFIILRQEVKPPSPVREEKLKPVPEEGISSEEKELIEAWILEQGLNQYGDPKDTVYMGGTPLFDEKTGKTIDKYEYILQNHPDRPWLR